jgi:proteasome accessory factor C
MGRTSAGDRLRRMLSIVPWVASQDGPPIDEVCRRFAVSRKELLADLDVLPYVGLYPYTPDQLVEVTITDDRVWITYADVFRRPLRLTPEQALALLAAGEAASSVPGAQSDGPLARGLAKLQAVLDVGPSEVLDVEIGAAPPGVLDTLREAVRSQRALQLDYYSHGRDIHTDRIVEPQRLFVDEGQWYLRAWCRRAEGARVFRVDRIRSARVLDETFEPVVGDGSDAIFSPGAEQPRVTLELAPAARWVIEQYPVEQVDELAEGRLRVRLVVTAPAWFARLLLRLGPDAVVVEGPADLAASGAAAARRMLERYDG